MSNDQPQSRRSSLAVIRHANLEAGPKPQITGGAATQLQHEDFSISEASDAQLVNKLLAEGEADSVAWDQDAGTGNQKSDPSSAADNPEKTLVRRSKMMREAECDMPLSKNLENQVERHLARCGKHANINTCMLSFP